ncbi:cation-translocating P-type ATPase [Actibacterium sp. 188UL27-1]|uniref:heavy metal translocating P-type ATPase n=1 Tax=Actibacterium sp. 188UL27-1 TaxID=2786961 RepID=UPI00195B347A|nr:heavy metal translocating P-type ATPase [Actibacterium sp. 188UL27-1]MBM7068776.1 cadmium-translocating P-type ATPase [Actibacterium sp. 188UL27-1]
MTDTAACPGCLARPADLAQPAVTPSQTLYVSLPQIHCAGCIAGVENTLTAIPGVASARVNLTQRRARIEAQGHIVTATLIAALTAKGYDARALNPEALAATQNDAAGRDLLLRLAIAGFATMNVMLLSVAVWSGATDATRQMFHWISAAIAVPAVAYAARPFFASAAAALMARRGNMDVPIAMAILLAMGHSIYEVLLGGHHAYFDAALSLTFFLLIGRYLDHCSRRAARSAADELAALEPPRATRITPKGDQQVAVDALAIGDMIRATPGTRLAIDGIIRRGRTDLDRALLTGEAMPAPATTGDAVHAGEIVLTGTLEVEVTQPAKHSTLNQLKSLVEVAERARSRYTSLADKAATAYVPLVHALAVLAFIGWYAATGDLRVALNIAVTVLIITCPCAMGLAIPAVSTVATSKLFRAGVLVKSATALERLCDIDTVIFDKTGTLTEGQPKLVNTVADAVLALAAGLGQGSAHPLSQALVAEAKTRDLTPTTVDNLQEHPGQGVSGTSQGRTVKLGNAAWLNTPEADGMATYLSDTRGQIHHFAFTDSLRDGAAKAVAALQTDGLKTVLLSGDRHANAARIAAEVGIPETLAEVTPAQKSTTIADRAGHTLMIGDGLNDTAALGAAHVSMSPAAAVDASRAVSDVVLMHGSLTRIPDTLSIARQARKRMQENLWLATAYNAIAIPIALAGFVTPLIAALAMSGSSIVVSLNALRIRSTP